MKYKFHMLLYIFLVILKITLSLNAIFLALVAVKTKNHRGFQTRGFHLNKILSQIQLYPLDLFKAILS
jgi:hypothetical protein